MKKIFVCTCLVLIALIAFVSCSKQDQPLLQSNRPYPPHPLAGQEMQFDSLAWQYEDDNTNIFISINNRPDLFMPFWKMDVSLKLDTSSTWIPVTISNGFVYRLYPGQLVIFPSPPDTSIADYYTSVKIKFH